MAFVPVACRPDQPSVKTLIRIDAIARERNLHKIRMVKIEVTLEFDRWLKRLRDLHAKERIHDRIRRVGDGNL
jgi:hypothetical protein